MHFDVTLCCCCFLVNLIILLQIKKVANSLHLENSPQFGDEWYQFLCEVGAANNPNYLYKNRIID